MRSHFHCLAAVVVLLSLAPVEASAPVRGIVGQPAPSWDGVRSWANLPDGVTTLDVSDFAGDVVYLFAFQSWCPGCHSHGFPTLEAVARELADEPDVHFVAVQTVFEGFQVNTEPKALSSVRQFDLDIPVGHDPGPKGGRSTILDHYRTGGTPWTALIDREGRVRFNDFSIRSPEAIALVRELLAEPRPDR